MAVSGIDETVKASNPRPIDRIPAHAHLVYRDRSLVLNQPLLIRLFDEAIAPSRSSATTQILTSPGDPFVSTRCNFSVNSWAVKWRKKAKSHVVCSDCQAVLQNHLLAASPAHHGARYCLPSFSLRSVEQRTAVECQHLVFGVLAIQNRLSMRSVTVQGSPHLKAPRLTLKLERAFVGFSAHSGLLSAASSGVPGFEQFAALDRNAAMAHFRMSSGTDLPGSNSNKFVSPRALIS